MRRNVPVALAALIAIGTAQADTLDVAAGVDIDKTLPEFSDLDVDGDGSISRTEAQAAVGVDASFAVLDRNADRKLSKDEYHVQAEGDAKVTK